MQVNPFAVVELAQAMHDALCMPEDERVAECARMRAVVAENNVYRWAGKIVSTLLRIDSDAGTGVPNPYPTPLTLPQA